MRKISILLITLAVIISLGGCGDLFNPAGNEVPKAEFNIPDSLTTQVARARPAGAPDCEGVFEPFRYSLAFIQFAVDMVNDIIDTVNSNIIPNEGSFPIDDGTKLVVIDYDETRDYARRIRVYEGTEENAAQLLLQVSYNPGINKGEAVFNVALVEPEIEVNLVKIVYDGTGTDPTLEGYLTCETTGKAATEIYPIATYFTGMKSGDLVSMEGAVTYHYVFGDPASEPYTEDTHAYMFQALADVSLDKALVNLYFPQVDAVSNVSEIDDTYAIGNAMAEIMYEWICLEENAALKADLEGFVQYSIDSAADLVSALYDASELPDVATLLFILELDNPIAYSGESGYVANGDDVPVSYTDIGDPGAIAFTMTPQQASSLAISFE